MSSEKTRADPEKPGPGPAEEPAPRDDVRIVGGSKHRCPFCHEDVDAEDPRGVVCGGCLARHHDECWLERQACSACAGTRRLVVDPPKPPATDEELLQMLALGHRQGVVTALKARGLDERQAEMVVELTASARGAPLGKTLERALLAQGLLLFAAMFGALGAAALGLIFAIVSVVVGMGGLIATMRRTRRAAVGQTLAFGLALQLGLILLLGFVIDGMKLAPGDPSIFFAGLLGGLGFVGLFAALTAHVAGGPPPEAAPPKTDAKT